MVLSESRIEELAWCNPAQTEALAILQDERLLQVSTAISRLGMQSDEAALAVAPGAYWLNQLPAADKKAALSHPQVAIWADYCTAWCADPSFLQHLYYYQSVAAAAAIRADHPFPSLTIPIQKEGAYLPGLGRAVFRNPNAAGQMAQVRYSSEGHITIAFGSETVHPPRLGEQEMRPGWQPARFLSAGVVSVELDDSSPSFYRMTNLEGASLAPRLTQEEFNHWAQLFEEAWDVLGTHLPQYQESIAATLRTLVPLRSEIFRASRAQTLGSIALSLPDDPWSLGQALASDSQKNILLALDRIVPLYDHHLDQARYAVPNLSLPVSFRRQLLSLHTHTATIDVLAARCKALAEGSPEYRLAFVEYTQWRDRYAELAAEVRRSPFLTTAGKVVIETLAIDQGRFSRDALHGPEEASLLARRLNFDEATCWRLRNLRPNQDQIAALAADIMEDGDGSTPFIRQIDVTLYPDYHRISGSYARKRLLFRDASSNRQVHHHPGDIALAGGLILEARRHYLDTIQDEQPLAAAEAWAGLAMTYTEDDPDQATHRALRCFPEIVHAVYVTLASEGRYVYPLSITRRIGELMNLTTEIVRE